MRKIAEEAFQLVKDYGGSHSGEHGDGIARSEFNEVMFGKKMAALFKQVKQMLDPQSIFNRQNYRLSKNGRSLIIPLCTRL